MALDRVLPAVLVAVAVSFSCFQLGMPASIAARSQAELYRQNEELSRHTILSGNGGSRMRRATEDDLVTRIRKATLNEDLNIPDVVQGDIKIFSADADSIRRGRREIINSNYFGMYSTWPSGIVPYTIQSSFKSASVSVIMNAMNDLQQRSCVTFVPAGPETAAFVGHNNSIDISSGSGCWSYIGNLDSGAQGVSLQETGCVYSGVVEHELLHALGFIHTQARPDRDRHVKVLVENVLPGYEENFYKSAFPSVLMPTAYDLYSVMHYGIADFSKSGSTLVPRVLEYAKLAGSRIAASFYDEKALNNLYNCAGSCDETVCQNDGYARMVGGSCVCKCPKGLGGQFCETIDRINYPCGDVINVLGNTPATVTSPNFPQNYNTGKSCAWLIKATGKNVIKISFNSMSLSSDPSKCRHFLDIRKNLIGQPSPSVYCGVGIPSEIYSRQEYQSRSVLVLFDASDTTYPASSGFSFSVSSYTDGCLSDPCRGAPCVSAPASSLYTCLLPPSDSFCGFESGNSVGCDVLRFSDIYDDYSGKVAGVTWDVSRTAAGVTAGSTAAEGLFFLLSNPLYNNYDDGSRNFGTFRIIPHDFTGSSRCLIFQYYAYGPSVGSLSVYKAVNGILGSPVFQQVNSTDNDTWDQAMVTIVSTGLPSDLIEIVFKVEHYSLSFDGDTIAVDDIRYVNGPCNSGPCSPGPCGNSGQCVETGSTYACVPFKNSGYASCSFESWESCSTLLTYAVGLNQFQTSNYAGVGHAWPRPTGPSGPATGYTYLYGSLYNKNPGTTMTLKIFNFSGLRRCLRFKYSMYGVDEGNVTVAKRVTFADGTVSNPPPLWSKKGNQGDFWFSAAVDVDNTLVPTTAMVELFIVATRGGASKATYASDVGFDDIIYSNGMCNAALPVTLY